MKRVYIKAIHKTEKGNSYERTYRADDYIELFGEIDTKYTNLKQLEMVGNRIEGSYNLGNFEYDFYVRIES